MAECVWLANTLKAAGLAAGPPPNKAGFADGRSWRNTLKQAVIRRQTKIDPRTITAGSLREISFRGNRVTGK